MTFEGTPGRSHGLSSAAAGSLAVAGLVAITLTFIELGPLSIHMLGHIGTMNILAPLCAVGLAVMGRLPASLGSSALLWYATSIQMGLLWAWHSQSIQHIAHSSTIVAALLHTGLLLAALVFWSAVIVSATRPWQTILALLISGKLACLLGALLVFSPRLLIKTASADDGAIADQHLAGLLMLAACPLSYILAAIVLTAQELASLQRQHGKIDRDRSPVGG